MILVTGAFGFIGGHTVRALLDAGERVIAARHRNGEVPDFLAADLGDRLVVETLDVTSAEAVGAVVEKHGASSILHMAAPPLGALGPAEEYRLNMQGLQNVLEAGQRYGMRRVSIASSVAVYHGGTPGPFREDQPLRMTPGSSTEAYKKAYEILSQHFASQTGLDVTCLRIGNIYGPGYRSLVNLPSRLVHAAARGVPGPLERPGAPEPFTEDGGDFCYVKDCAQGLARVHLGDKLQHRTYNIGAGRMSTFGEFAEAVRAAKPGADVTLTEGRGPAHVDDAVMDITRAREDVGYAPQYRPAEGVAEYLAWLEAGHDR